MGFTIKRVDKPEDASQELLKRPVFTFKHQIKALSRREQTIVIQAIIAKVDEFIEREQITGIDWKCLIDASAQATNECVRMAIYHGLILFKGSDWIQSRPGVHTAIVQKRAHDVLTFLTPEIHDDPTASMDEDIPTALEMMGLCTAVARKSIDTFEDILKALFKDGYFIVRTHNRHAFTLVPINNGNKDTIAVEYDSLQGERRLLSTQDLVLRILNSDFPMQAFKARE